LLNSPGANEVMSASTGTAQPKSARPISITPDGTEDTKLYVRGLPDITIRPWKMEDTWDSDADVEYMDGADAELIPGILPY